MRFLRIAAVIILAISLVFTLWANGRYYSSLNMDYPVISNGEEVLQISVQDPPETLFRGLSAQDGTDGDLTDQIMIASVSHFLEPGTVSVKYVVFDSHNNSDTLTRRVHYTDYVPPVYTLEKAPVYTVGRPFDLLDYVQVTDCIDGDISDNVRVISNMVNNFSAGYYPVVLEASNSCGNTAQITLWVSFLSKENTVAVNLQRYIVYIPQGETFEPMQLLLSVTDRNGAALDAANVEVQGNLNTEKPGCYQLIYSYNDGKLSGESPLTVVVTERQG